MSSEMGLNAALAAFAVMMSAVYALVNLVLSDNDRHKRDRQQKSSRLSRLTTTCRRRIFSKRNVIFLSVTVAAWASIKVRAMAVELQSLRREMDDTYHGTSNFVECVKKLNALHTRGDEKWMMRLRMDHLDYALDDAENAAAARWSKPKGWLEKEEKEASELAVSFDNDITVRMNDARLSQHRGTESAAAADGSSDGGGASVSSSSSLASWAWGAAAASAAPQQMLIERNLIYNYKTAADTEQGPNEHHQHPDTIIEDNVKRIKAMHPDWNVIFDDDDSCLDKIIRTGYFEEVGRPRTVQWYDAAPGGVEDKVHSLTTRVYAAAFSPLFCVFSHPQFLTVS